MLGQKFSEIPPPMEAGSTHVFKPVSARSVFSPMGVQISLPHGNSQPYDVNNVSHPALERLDHFDYLPDHFVNTLAKALEESGHKQQQGALLLVSISNMPMLVSAYGHSVAETILSDLSGAIRGAISANDSVFRIQRDELAIVMTHASTEQVAALGARIGSIIEKCGHLNPSFSALHVIHAIGSVCFPQQASQLIEVLDKAYLALSSAPHGIHRTYLEISEDTEKARQQMGLANYLYRAYQEKRLRMAYQPIIDSRDGSVVHYEALLRIVSPSGQISSAGPLIPIAERMGLIDKIDTMVLELVVKELRQSPNIALAFNVSNLTTDNADWLETFNRLMQETPEIASRLIVEITETAAQRDLRRAAYFVASIQSQGALVALDDFGSGYTSFRQLKSLSVDLVKIDGVFIKDIVQNADSLFFVKTLLDFAKGFGLKAVAEFVESGEIAKKLMDLGVDYLQGYYFGKPENHRSWLNEGEYGRD